MGELVRFGVSIPSDLLEEYDELIKKKGYPNRSEAFRYLVREQLIEKDWEKEEQTEVAGTLSLVYDHHVTGLSTQLINLQHQYHHIIMSTMHIHLDHDNCLEVLVLKGDGKDVKELADKLSTCKGIKHSKLAMTTTGKHI